MRKVHTVEVYKSGRKHVYTFESLVQAENIYAMSKNAILREDIGGTFMVHKKGFDKPKIVTGMCPVCKEWTEVSAEENGCCNAGCYFEGGNVTFESFEQ